MDQEQRKVRLDDNVRVVTANDFIKASFVMKNDEKKVEGKKKNEHKDISVNARKLLYIAISQCRMDDKDFFEFKMTVKELADFLGVKTNAVYNITDRITDELMSGFIRLETEQGKRKYRKFNMFEYCEYDESTLTLKLSNQIKHLVLELKRDFTQPLLHDFSKMRSSYSMSVWHMLQKKMKSKKAYANHTYTFDIGLEEFRESTATTDKLKQIGQLKEKCLDIACRDITDCTGNRVTYTDIKQGRRIVGFRFLVKSLYYQSDFAE